MKGDLVSIVIPVYNGSKYLKTCIESALSQSYDNVEVIVINDGSNDDGKTDAIAKSFENKIRYFYKENGGVSSALNLGIKKMNGKWFSWLSHDDLYLPDKIKVQIKSAYENKGDKRFPIVMSGVDFIDEYSSPINFMAKKRRILPGKYTSRDMMHNLLRNGNINGCSLLIPKNDLINVDGFKENYKYIQDFICWINMCKNGAEFFILDEALIKSRVHADQQTKRLSKTFKTEIRTFFDELAFQGEESAALSPREFTNIVFFGAKNGIFIESINFIRSTNVSSSLLKKYIYGIMEIAKAVIVYFLKKLYRFAFSIMYRG